MLVAELVENVTNDDERLALEKEILEHAHPVFFAVECFRWIRTLGSKDEDESDSVSEENKQLGEVVARRIEEFARDAPLYRIAPTETPTLLAYWALFGQKDQASQYLLKTLDQDEENVVEFLKCYLPTSWGESGLSSKGDFERHQYDQVSRIVDPDHIYENLLAIYGDELETPQFDRGKDRPVEEKVAHQFAYIHHHVKEEAAKDPTEDNVTVEE